jgi:hypothetical protein
MKYMKPQILTTVPALSTIKSAKIAPNQEVGSSLPTNGAAYQSDE